MPGTTRVALTLTQCWHRVPGGTATSVLRLAGALAARGDVALVGVAPRSRRTPPAPWTPPEPLVHLPLPLPILYDAWTRIRWPSLEAATGPVDVVHVTVPVAPPPTTAPMVATVHDVLPLSSPELFTGRGARLMRTGLRRLCDECRLVMVPSTTVAEDCAALGVDPDRLRVVPWAVDPVTVTHDDVVRVRRAHGLRGPYVLFVGTLEPRKGLGVLARALARLGRPGLSLVVAGPPGWGAAEDDLEGLATPVHRLGFVPEDDLPALQHGAEVVALPSLAEGFGLPVLESLAAGAAVVTSEGTATEEVAGDAALVVPPGDAAALADALARLLDDAALASLLRFRGPERAAAFTWARTAELVHRVYEEARA